MHSTSSNFPNCTIWAFVLVRTWNKPTGEMSVWDDLPKLPNNSKHFSVNRKTILFPTSYNLQTKILLAMVSYCIDIKNNKTVNSLFTIEYIKIPYMSSERRWFIHTHLDLFKPNASVCILSCWTRCKLLSGCTFREHRKIQF